MPARSVWAPAAWSATNAAVACSARPSCTAPGSRPVTAAPARPCSSIRSRRPSPSSRPSCAATVAPSIAAATSRTRDRRAGRLDDAAVIDDDMIIEITIEESTDFEDQTRIHELVA
jgi:hypothetical protein